MAKRDIVRPLIANVVFRRDRSCVAPQVDPDEMGKCWGRLTIEHVKERPRMGLRAESDPRHLVALCMGHTEPGMKAGRQWNTRSENRAKIRAYLAQREGADPQ